MACREGGRRGAREEGEEGNVGVGAKEMIETTRIPRSGAAATAAGGTDPRSKERSEAPLALALVPRVFVVLRSGCPRTHGA